MAGRANILNNRIREIDGETGTSSDDGLDILKTARRNLVDVDKIDTSES